MKKLYSLIAALLILSIMPTIVCAQVTDAPPDEIIYFDDGSYIVVRTTVIDTRDTSTKRATKTYTQYDTSNVLQWTATLSATFVYNGFTSTCTYSDVDISIINSSWYTISQSAGKSSNTAVAKVSMGYKVLGITTTQKDITISITCDANGNLT